MNVDRRKLEHLVLAVTRRDLLKSAAASPALGLCGDALAAAAARGRFNIGACDWSIGMRGKTEALALARQLGLDGVQVSMGSVENDLQLRRPEVQRAYRDAADGERRPDRRRRARPDEPGALQVRPAHRAMGQRQHRRRPRARRPRRPARVLRAR